MEFVQIKKLGSNNWKDTKFKSIDKAIKAVRDTYKVFGIIHCQLRFNGKEWDNF